MVAVAGTLALRPLLDRPSAGTAGAYVVLAALTVYAHYLFGIMLPSMSSTSSRGDLQDGTPPWGRIGIVLAAIGVLLLPLGLRFCRSSAGGQACHGRRAILPTYSLWWPFPSPSPCPRGESFAVGERPSIGRHCCSSWPGVSCPLSPVSLVTWLTSLRLFFPRYYLAWTPGLALLAGLVIRTVEGFPARRLIAIGLVVLTVAVSGPHLRSGRHRVDLPVR